MATRLELFWFCCWNTENMEMFKILFVILIYVITTSASVNGNLDMTTSLSKSRLAMSSIRNSLFSFTNRIMKIQLMKSKQEILFSPLNLHSIVTMLLLDNHFDLRDFLQCPDSKSCLEVVSVYSQILESLQSLKSQDGGLSLATTLILSHNSGTPTSLIESAHMMRVSIFRSGPKPAWVYKQNTILEKMSFKQINENVKILATGNIVSVNSNFPSSEKCFDCQTNFHCQLVKVQSLSRVRFLHQQNMMVVELPLHGSEVVIQMVAHINPSIEVGWSTLSIESTGLLSSVKQTVNTFVLQKLDLKFEKNMRASLESVGLGHIFGSFADQSEDNILGSVQQYSQLNIGWNNAPPDLIQVGPPAPEIVITGPFLFLIVDTKHGIPILAGKVDCANSSLRPRIDNLDSDW